MQLYCHFYSSLLVVRYLQNKTLASTGRGITTFVVLLSFISTA